MINNEESNWESEGGSIKSEHRDGDVALDSITTNEMDEQADSAPWVTTLSQRNRTGHSSDEVRIVSETGGEKGQKSIQLHAIPYEALAEVGKVYAFGSTKYENYNFRRGYAWSLSYDALQRHLWAFWNREDNDSESGYSHLAHAAWHCFTLLFYSLTGRGKDDRPL